MTSLFLAAMAALCPPPARPVEPADAYGFGVPYEVAAANARTADRHRWAMDDELRQLQTPTQFYLWCQQQNWRRDCWADLKAALDPATTERDRARNLRELRDLIGDDNYFARRMPCAIPSYRR